MLSVRVRQMQGVCVLYNNCTISVSQAACIAVSCRILINLPFLSIFMLLHTDKLADMSVMAINTKSNC